MKRRADRRYVRRGELLLIDENFVERDRADRGAFFWLFAPPSPVTEYFGPVAVVHIRGPLEHHDEGGSDSYDAIRDRAREAIECEEVESVVMRIDSPGGSAHGLMGLVADLIQLKKANKKRLIAYCDDYACSAAYAISCAADEIIVTPTSITGSIGVISTMVDVTKRDKQEGLTFVTIASGKRKSDGHIHVPITADAIAAERPRIEKLASDFFALVSSSRGLSVKKIRSYEAGIFLGDAAIQAGIADDCMAWDELLLALGAEQLAPESDSVQSDGTHGSYATQSSSTPRRASNMSKLKIEARIAKLRQKIAAEKDPIKLHTLSSQLGSLTAALQVAPHRAGGSPMQEDDEDDEEDEEDEDDEEDEASATPVGRQSAARKVKAKGNETKRDDDDDDDDDDDSDDDDDGDKDDDDDDDDDEAMTAIATARGAVLAAKTPKARSRAMKRYEATLAGSSKVLEVARKVTGQRSTSAVIGALEGLRKSTARIDKLERKSRMQDVRETVRAARSQGKISKAEASSYIEAAKAGTVDPRWLKGHLAALPKQFRAISEGPAIGDPNVLAQLAGGLPQAPSSMQGGFAANPMTGGVSAPNPYAGTGTVPIMGQSPQMTAEDQAALAGLDGPTQSYIYNSVAAGILAPDGKRHTVATYAAQLRQQLGMTGGRSNGAANGVIR